jgi:hypothetical protein
VADLASLECSPSHELTVQDQPPADARAHGQEEQVALALPGSELPLGEGRAVGVVLEHEAAAELALQAVDQRHVVPARQIRRAHDHTARHVDRPG